MTSYGKFEDLQAIAQVMVDSLRFMLENTFEQRPEGGPELDFSGFPGWCMYVLAMYAQVRARRLPASCLRMHPLPPIACWLCLQEIGANVVLDKFIIDSRLDAFSDSARPVHELLHVHCQQGADRFNKAQFFMHQYSTVDLSSMDTTITRDCVTNLAVGSFRSAFGSINKRSPKVDDLHTEL